MKNCLTYLVLLPVLALGIEGIYWYQWYSKTGMLKSFIEYGKSAWWDSTGTVILDSIQSYDIFYFMGEYDIDPDTLKPWGES